MRPASWIVAGMVALTVSLLTLSACDDGALTGLDDVDPSAGANARVAPGDSTARAGGVPGEGASSLDRYALLGRILSADGNPDSVRVHVKSWHTDYNETGYATLGIPAKGTIYHWGAAHSEGVDIHGEGGVPALGRDALYALSFDSPARGDALLVLLPSAVDVDTDTYFTWDNGDIAITSQAIGARTHILEDISSYNDIGWRKAVCAGGRFGRIVFEGDSLDVSTVLHRRFYGAISGEATGEIPKDVSGCGTSSDAFDVQLLGFADDDAYQMIDWRPIVSESVSQSVSGKSSTASATASGNGLNRSKPAAHAPASVNLSASTVNQSTSVTFSASPDTICKGLSSTLSWSSEHTTSVSIDQGIGTVETKGERSVSPDRTTTYTIVARGPGGSKFDRATVQVHLPPSVSLSASPGMIDPGGSSTLVWSSEHATLVSIDQGIGSVGASGERSVSPDRTTTYTIVATNPCDTVTDTVAVTVTADAQNDRAALVALYDSTDGDNWKTNTNWKSSAAIGTWYGVTTDNAGRVIFLNLDRNSLSGSIPAALGDLTKLVTLDLYDNSLSGSIPAALGDLTNLEKLSLYYNDLTGSIPAELGDLTNLTSLHLYSNSLSGSIPAALGDLTNLTNLNLGDNDLSGSIPAELGDLTNLTTLWIGENSLSGSIPAALGDFTNLEHLHLGGNSLSGSIPAALGDLTNLTSLHLYNNSLSGSIPAALGDLTNLRNLHLGGNSLTGSIPAALGDLTSLQTLHLGGNSLTGSIPAALGDLTSLEVLSLFENSLTGSIPAALGGLTNLERMSLNDNSLTGSIPAALGDLTNLEWLNLGRNSLSGSIPAALGDLTNLVNLLLSPNSLSGSIPAEFVNLDNLLHFYVDNGLCVPGSTAFQQWLDNLALFSGDSDNICNQQMTRRRPTQTPTKRLRRERR